MLRAKFLAKFAICPLYRDSPLLGNAMGHTGSVLDIPRQLAASSVDVITPGFANGGHKTRLNEHTCKFFNCGVFGSEQTRFFEGVEWN